LLRVLQRWLRTDTENYFEKPSKIPDFDNGWKHYTKM